MMNDGTNLYMAVKVDGDPTALTANDLVLFMFDNNHVAAGSHQVGDDQIWLTGAPMFSDEFWMGVVWGTDVGAGGTTDGQGTVARQGSSNHFELSHPLDDADNAHDFSRSTGQTVGFLLFLNVDGWGVSLSDYGLGSTPGDLQYYANYVVAQQPRPPTVTPKPVGGVVMPTSKLEIVAPLAALAGLIVAVSAVVAVKRRRD